MNHKKQNCWQFEKCGREPDGSKVSEYGICSAAEATEFNGQNSGKNGGRRCWKIAGTLCGSKPQGITATKILNCAKCNFFITVRLEEKDDFKL